MCTAHLIEKNINEERMTNIVGTGNIMSTKQNAFKESVFDTGIGMSINIPLNWIMLTLGLYWELEALELSILMTSVFTAFAISRKYFVRVHFTNKEIKARQALLSPKTDRPCVVGDI